MAILAADRAAAARTLDRDQLAAETIADLPAWRSTGSPAGSPRTRGA